MRVRIREKPEMCSVQRDNEERQAEQDDSAQMHPPRNTDEPEFGMMLRIRFPHWA
ncbi:hypothetical protein HRbin27_01784 [bacterium HR27]|nr:hypothetical protein HRbin27_01784 [bacterium HR27]